MTVDRRLKGVEETLREESREMRVVEHIRHKGKNKYTLGEGKSQEGS